MTTFYMDYEGGSDANNGTSFALRWKTFASGATAARTAPGDTIRIMASPDATSLGITGVWTDGPLNATRAIVSSTNATPIVITLSDANWTLLAPAVGDTIIVNGHTTNTKANGVWELSAVSDAANTITLINADGTNSVGNGVGGASGTVRKITNCRVKLASALTTNIALCGNRGTKTNWTASANVTCTVNTTDYKEGGECQQIAIAAGFATGLAAYIPITSLDLSARQQVSFWIKQTAGTIGAASSISLTLCTDALGATPAHTINIPALGALNQWAQISFDNAANMNAAIQSVGFVVNTDNAAQTFLLDNITASNAASSANSIKLSSLVSKNTGDEVWYGLQSINGTRLMLDGTTNTIPAGTPQRGYSGTTETVTTYKRETVKKVMAASGGSVETVQEAGSSGSLITYSGGWNRTDMSTQTGETWWDGQNGIGSGIVTNVGTFTSYDKLNLTRYGTSFLSSPAADITIGSMHICNSTSSAFSVVGNRFAATLLSGVCCGQTNDFGSSVHQITTISRASGMGGAGVTITGGGGQGSGYIGTISQANNNGGIGVTSGVFHERIGSIVAQGNAGAAYSPSSNSVVGSLTATSNVGAAIAVATVENWAVLGGSSTGNASGVTTSTGTGTLRNFTINEATEVSGFSAMNNGRVYSEKHDGGSTAKIFCDGGLIVSQATTVHGSATLAWKFSPTSANRTANYPLNLVIAKVACAASALVTIKAWFQRDSVSLTGALLCKGGQIAGVSADVSSSMTAAINTWEELTITFTPSEAGVVEIEGLFYGGTTLNGYISDMTISQA
jgi:hypothetical protein